MKKILTVLTLFITSIGFSQYTSIPDPVFEQVLIDLGYDTGVPDGTVLTSNISVVDSLNLSDILVTDLTGIEDFDSLRYLNCSSTFVSGLLTSLDVSNNTSLTHLECFGNPLTSLDVSNNTSLTYLKCGYDSLTSLDVSNNTSLTYLKCNYNSLTSLDVSNNTSLTYLDCGFNSLTSLDVSNNTSLTQLFCGPNQLTSLDVSNNTSLTQLFCGQNQLTSLDVSNNTSLTRLICNYNSLTSLDVSNNTSLTQLFCGPNQLTSLDVSNNTSLTHLECFGSPLTSLDVSNNTSLTYLSCFGNQLTSLDVSNNTSLTHVNCSSNLLECLNIKNGNNSIITLFDCTDNPNLSCIEVENRTYSIQNWTDIDSQQYFSSNCDNPCSSILGLTEVTSKSTFLFPNPTDNTTLLKIDGIITDNLRVHVFNTLGQHVMSVPVSSSSVNLDINTLGKGTYIVKLIDDNNSVMSTERLVKY